MRRTIGVNTWVWTSPLDDDALAVIAAEGRAAWASARSSCRSSSRGTGRRMPRPTCSPSTDSPPS